MNIWHQVASGSDDSVLELLILGIVEIESDVTYEDVADKLGISFSKAKVICNRASDRGLIDPVRGRGEW